MNNCHKFVTNTAGCKFSSVEEFCLFEKTPITALFCFQSDILAERVTSC